jgi:hypothetical protein
MRGKPNLKAVSDDELLRRLSEILKRSRGDEADLVEHLAEVDARRLYARQATPSMYAYCTEVLHLCEAEAWLRIRAARASRKHPMLLPMLRDGRLHISGIVVLAPHLTPDNRQALLKRAVHKTKRQIEEIVAEVAPREDVPAVVRKLPTRRAQPSMVPTGQLSPGAVVGSGSQLSPETAGGSDVQLFPDTVEGRDSPSGHGAVASGRAPATVAPRARPARMEPLAPARFKVEFTADAELRDMLERLQALMRSSATGGDLAAVVKVAVAEKLERLEAKRFAKTKAPRKTLAETDTTPRNRHIPAAVRRVVHERDGGRCTYRDKRGRRCSKRHDLEFHHREPFGQGGEHNPEMITLHCRTHNALMAEQDYGEEVMARFRRSSSCVSEPITVYGVLPGRWEAKLPSARRGPRSAANVQGTAAPP